MKNRELVAVKNLRKHFPIDGRFSRRSSAQVKAVDGVDLVIRKGEAMGLVGESGCGKSTLGRCILRLEEPTSGEIYFEKKNITTCNDRALRPLRCDMQIIFQDPYSSLNPRKTVEKIIGEGFAIHGILPRDERRTRIMQLMEVVGLLPDAINRYPHEFSGGQRQRLCIARSLALNPKLIIADEPVSALDVSIQAQILNLLVRLQREFDFTYVFISHDLSVVRHISDRVAVMYLGRILELTERNLLYEHPLHPYTIALISAIPTADPLAKKERVILKGDVPSSINPPPGCSFHPRCTYRQDICMRVIPEMKELEAGHWVACHFPILKNLSKTDQK